MRKSKGKLMKVLLVYAHPEAKSFNGSMRDLAVETLADAGHEVVVSDLYGLGFNAVAGPADVVTRKNEGVFNLGLEQMHAAGEGAFAADIQAELDKFEKDDTYRSVR